MNGSAFWRSGECASTSAGTMERGTTGSLMDLLVGELQ